MKIELPVLLLVVAVAGCTTKGNQINTIKTADAIPVKLIAINQDSGSNTIDVSGLLATENEAKLSFKIGGVVETILVKEGDYVRQGQLLATLKSAEIAAQVQQVVLAVEKAQRDYQRASNLFKDSVTTLEQLQNAKTGVDIARQNLQQVAFNQQYSKIYAPANGFVVKKATNVGELVNPGSPVLLMNVVSATSHWILRVGLADREWAMIEKGNDATVTLDAFPAKVFPGVVSKKALSADDQNGSFVVEVQVNLLNEQPAAGMFGTARITPSEKTVGYTIPYESLLEANGKNGFVFVSDDRKTVKKVPVTIGEITTNHVSITQGLESYKYVVTAGSPYLSDNGSIIAQQ